MRLFLKIVLGLVFLIIISVAAIPYLLSTGPGTRFIEGAGDGEMKIKRLSLGWFSEQTIEGFSYQDAQTQITFKKLEVNDSLLGIIFHGLRLKDVKLLSPNVDLILAKKSGGGSFAGFFLLNNFELEDGKLTIRKGKNPPITFSDISAKMQFPGRGEPININLFAKTKEGAETGIVNVKTRLNFDPKNWKETLNYQLDATIRNLPISGIDRLLSYKGLLVQAVGKSLDMQAKIKTDSSSYSAQAKIDTDLIRARIDTESSSTPADIHWRITPEMSQLIGDSQWTLKEAANLELILKSFKIPTINGRLSFPSLALAGSLQVSKLHFDQMTINSLQINGLSESLQQTSRCKGRLSLQSNYLNAPFEFEGSLHDLKNPRDVFFKVTSDRGTLADKTLVKDLTLEVEQNRLKSSATIVPNASTELLAFIGSPLELNFTGDVAITPNYAILLPQYAFDIKSDVLSTKIFGSVSPNFSKVSVSKPFTIAYQLIPDRWTPVRERLKSDFLVKKKTAIAITVDPFTYDSSIASYPLSYVKAKLFTEKIELEDVVQKEVISLDQVHAYFNLDQKSQEMDFQLESDVEKEGSLHGDLTVRSFDLRLKDPYENANFTLNINGEGIPSKWFTPLLDINPVAPQLIGEKANLSANFILAESKKQCKMKLDAPLLKINGFVDFQNDLKLGSRAPLKIQWTLTPEGFQAINHLTTGPAEPLYFTLLKPIDLSLNLDRLNIPLKEGKFIKSIGDDFSLMAFKGALKLENLVIKDVETGMIAEAPRSKFLLDKKPKDPLFFDTNSKIASKASEHGEALSGSVDGTGALLIPVDKDGKPNYGQLELTTSLKVSHIPSMLIDALFRAFKLGTLPPSAILGNYVNSTLKASIKSQNGTLALDVDASQAKLDLDGVVINNKLMLKRPLTARMNLTKRLDKILFNEFDIFAIRSRKPIRLRIDEKGFILPLNELNPSTILMPSIQLQLGKMRFYNRGNMSQMGGIFKLEGQDVSELWFAPLDMHFSRGLLDIERTEILYDNRYHICTWGNIDFNKRYVNMIIGLTSQALASGMGLTGLSPDYVFKIPFKGPFGNIHIDKGAVVGKIALMIAKEGAKSQAGAFGGIIDVFGSLIDDQSDVPPPKKPYPWGNRLTGKVHVDELNMHRKKRKQSKEKQIFDYPLPMEYFHFPERSS
ncbi:MAG: hypothetical protein MRY21_08455 [Simkaniaceae bacterium]|nr:hypothetical protein [Simkaniaceae bacterium]